MHFMKFQSSFLVTRVIQLASQSAKYWPCFNHSYIELTLILQCTPTLSQCHHQTTSYFSISRESSDLVVDTETLHVIIDARIYPGILDDADLAVLKLLKSVNECMDKSRECWPITPIQVLNTGLKCTVYSATPIISLFSQIAEADIDLKPGQEVRTLGEA